MQKWGLGSQFQGTVPWKGLLLYYVLLFTLAFSLKSITEKLYGKCDDFIFLIDNSLSSVAIFKQQQLGLVPSTAIYRTEQICWRKSCSNYGTELLGCSHRYNNSTIVFKNWSTARKYPFLKWQWIFSILHIFSILLSQKIFLGDLVHMVHTSGIWHKLPTICLPRGFGVVRVLILLLFYLVFSVLCLSSSCVVSVQCCLSLDCPFLIVSSVFSDVYVE